MYMRSALTKLTAMKQLDTRLNELSCASFDVYRVEESALCLGRN
jgi:hypothetical protein